MHNPSPNTSNRRGAALIVAIVLLAVLGVVAGIMLPQVLRDRQKNRQDLLRTQSRLLLDDALRSAVTKRSTNPDFSGETLLLGPDQQPFAGTFQVTTRFEDDVFVGKVEYRDKNGRVLVRHSNFSHKGTKDTTE